MDIKIFEKHIPKKLMGYLDGGTSVFRLKHDYHRSVIANITGRQTNLLVLEIAATNHSTLNSNVVKVRLKMWGSINHEELIEKLEIDTEQELIELLDKYKDYKFPIILEKDYYL